MARPAPTNPGALVGIAEIAQLAGVSKQRASQIVENQGFPAPYDRLAMGDVWKRPGVLAYLERTAHRRRPPTTTRA